MEFLLLWIDDLDDALGALRHLAPKVLGFFVAVALFAATGFALVTVPHITLAVIIAVLLSALLFETARQRRMSRRQAAVEDQD